MAKLMFIPLSRFYARKDSIGEDDVGRRRGGQRGGRRGGGGGRRQRRGGRGGGGQRRGGAKGGGQRASKPERRVEPEEERYDAMDEGGEDAAYVDEDEGYDDDEGSDADECSCEEDYDPYDDFERPSLAGRRGWNPAMALGTHIQVRAAEGRRAAVKELEPGLWLVAELPDEEAVGAIALAPIILFAAKKALGKMGVSLANTENRGKLKEAVREAVIHAKARIKERRAKRKAKKEQAEPAQKKLRLPRPVEIGCRGRDRC